MDFKQIAKDTLGIKDKPEDKPAPDAPASTTVATFSDTSLQALRLKELAQEFPLNIGMALHYIADGSLHGAMNYLEREIRRQEG